MDRIYYFKGAEMDANWTTAAIKGLDKTTVDGLAEALLIAMCHTKDIDGKAMPLHIDVNIARQVAAMLLGESTT